MADFSLKAVFGMDASGVRTELKSLRREFNSFVEDYAKLGAGLAVTAFDALSKSALELAGRLSDTAINVGINVESLQALEAQHKRNGVPAELLTKTLEKLRTGVEKAREGDEKAVGALAKLGLTWQNLAALPLEQKYEAIAKAQFSAKDQAQAYNAVCDLFGEKVGPKIMSSLKELAEDGWKKVEKNARDAGQVMSAETIVALDKAGDAIDDFKKKATVAVGNIIVNFRSEEGLKLLGMQFLRVVGVFGAGIVDAITEAGKFTWAILKGTFSGVLNFFRDGFVDIIGLVAEKWNSIIPDWMKKKGFTIDVAAIDALKSAGKSVSEEITEAIAKTAPSTFKKEVGEFWDKSIKDQQKVVDALNKKDFGKDAEKLRTAGKQMEKSLKDGAKSVEDAGKKVKVEIEEAGESFVKHWKDAAFAVFRTGADYANQSTIALQGTRARLRAQFEELDRDHSYESGNAPFAKNPLWYAVKSELALIERELAGREKVTDYAKRFGEDAARFQFGDEATNKAIQDLAKDTTRTAQATESIQQRLSVLLGK